MQAWSETELLVYWTRQRKQPFRLDQPPANLLLALIHQDYFQTFPSTTFSVQKPYFRLINEQIEFQNHPLITNEFSFVEVSIQQEIEMVSQLIGQCYPNSQPTPESVTSWTKHPTFDPTLWIWVTNSAKKYLSDLE